LQTWHPPVRRGRQFSYFGRVGRRIADPAPADPYRKLAIPPAYQDVWICSDPRGHLQATGRDARGRKQYRYHPEWRTHRDAAKFDRMLEFGRSLRESAGAWPRTLRKPGLPRDKVLATLVRLLERTLIRIGNEEYARSNARSALTTLRDRHVRIRGAS